MLLIAELVEVSFVVGSAVKKLVFLVFEADFSAMEIFPEIYEFKIINSGIMHSPKNQENGMSLLQDKFF